MSHLPHLCLSVLTCGLWIPIWIICTINASAEECGSNQANPRRDVYDDDATDDEHTEITKPRIAQPVRIDRSRIFESMGRFDLYQPYTTAQYTVAEVQNRLEEAKRFVRGEDQSLVYEREPDHPDDKNAIKIFGVFDEDGTTCRIHLGYADPLDAKLIAEDGVLAFVVPEIKHLYCWGHKVVIHYQTVIMTTKMQEIQSTRQPTQEHG